MIQEDCGEQNLHPILERRYTLRQKICAALDRYCDAVARCTTNPSIPLESADAYLTRLQTRESIQKT